ncbi:hypothetical protein PG989_002384 [Apiospora arundinis]
MKVNAILILASAVSVLAAPVAEAQPADEVTARADYGAYGKYGNYGQYKPPASYASYGAYRRAVDWVKDIFV